MWKNSCIPGSNIQFEDSVARQWANQNPIFPNARVSPYMNPQDFMQTETYRNVNAAFMQNGFQSLPPGVIMPMFQTSQMQAGTYMRSRM